MKLMIDRGALIKPSGHAYGVVERRNPVPILANLVLRAENSQLTVIATDLDMDIVETVPAAIMEPGVITVSAQLLHDIVRKLPEGAEIEIANADEGQVKVQAGRSNFSLPTLPIEDFPAISAEAMTTEFTLDAGTLKALIENTRFAISTEETRYYLNGIYLHLSEDRMLRAVSTDGHRLARAQVPMPQGAETMPSVIVPRKAVGELSKLIDEYDGDVGVGITDSRARFTVGAITLTTKLIDGNFPDYQRVIPTDNSNILQVSAAAFREAVDRVSTVSSDKTRAVKLHIVGGMMTLSSSADSASGEETLEVSYHGSDLDIGYNARYLMDVAAQIDGEMIEFALADSALPSLIRGPDDEANLFVLMPMRV